MGGAAVLASYLRAATADFEGRSLIVHAGDWVGASPPESALLQDEPAVQVLNLLANGRCRGARRSADGCNIVETPGNHEFDEGTTELLRLIYGGVHPGGPFLGVALAGRALPVRVGKRAARHRPHTIPPRREGNRISATRPVG